MTSSKPHSRPAIVTGPLLLRFVSVVAAAVSFYLPLGVTPSFVASSGVGGAGGIANGALLIATVAGEMVTPWIVHRIGHRAALGLGLVMLGAPALLLVASHGFVLVLVVAVLRGLGFAVTVVAGGALTALLLPAERRSEGLAVVGLVGGVPGLLALPFGVWASGHWGYAPIFVVTAAAPLLAILTVAGLPGRATQPAGQREHGIVAALRNRSFTGPAAVFATSAAAAGVVVTFVPLAMNGHAWLAPVALFLQPTASTLARWVAGRLGDRIGQRPLLAPGLVLSVAGMAALAMIGSPVLVCVGATVFGLGFGVLQNATLGLMYSGAQTGEYGAVSALWNAGYDAGMAFGALAGAVVVGIAGSPAVFVAAAVVMLPALWGVRRRTAGTTPVETAPPAPVALAA